MLSGVWRVSASQIQGPIIVADMTRRCISNSVPCDSPSGCCLNCPTYVLLSFLRHGHGLIRCSLAAAITVRKTKVVVAKIAPSKDPIILPKGPFVQTQLPRIRPFVSCNSGTECCCGK